ncbi:hypothetical protein CHL78_007705 [Romboutsia weinsteinii]|uniref:histidine kinase n=1 Tax=Romboutsia weinsteinii TaxID=2020949 RepID=A0A371J513_9FIRM|nr:sensor histidine kinase [Romboutsia weinsteinii]RDY27880.1 hypothetical protein CHL78_007705 [Romboutsia weinsteinii]
MFGVVKVLSSTLLISLTLVLGIPTNISADKPGNTSKSNFKKVNVEDGLSSEYITAILQERKGYMWIGTSDGLNRYDGNRIETYNCDSKNKNSLSSNYITALAEDPDGNLWIGTDNGLNILYRESNTIVRVSEEYKNLRKITTIYEDSNGTMWIGTDKGLYNYNVDSKKGVIFTSEEDDKSLTHNSVTSIDEIITGYLWVGTRSGISVINLKTDEIYKSGYDKNNRPFIYDIEADNNGDVWVATKKNIIKCVLDEDGTSYIPVENIPIDIGEDLNTDIRNIMSDSKNNLWLTSSNGVIKYSADDKSTKLYKNKIHNKNSLSSNSVLCYYEDFNGIIWIGTDNGINILSESNQFTSIGSSPYNDGTLSGNNITTIHEDKYGYTWVGTKDNGVDVLDKNNNVIKSYYHDPNNESSLPSNNILYITSSVKSQDFKNIIVYTDKGYSLIDLSTNKVSNLLINDDYVIEVKSAYADDELFWSASNNSLSTYNRATNKTTYHNDNLSKFDIDYTGISYIAQDPNDHNILWLGGNNTGLVKFHKSDGVQNRYISDINNQDSIIHNTINTITFDSIGNMWVGTSIGLSKFDIKNEKFTSYTVADGLSNNFINSILIDDDNNPWISTNYGINKFNVKENRFINFTEMDGIKGLQFNPASAHKYKDGSMVFGSSKGLTFFNPKDIVEPSPINNKVVIGDIYINKDKTNYDSKNLVTSHNDNNIKLDFFLPNYKNSENITYEYMLEGLENTWTYAGSRNYVNYSALPPGSYTFKIRARDDHGNLSEETKFNIKINNPLWKTPFAYFIYLFILIGLVIYSINYVKILQNLVAQKTRKLNSELDKNRKLSSELINQEKFKNNYFVNLSHELRTPIHVIFSTVQLINLINKNGDVPQKKSKEYMAIIAKNCNHLLNIINDIIDSSKIETGEYKIHKENNDIVYLVEESALNMNKLIEDKSLTLIIDPDIEEKIISCDKEEIERCIINLLGNATKFTPEGGEIRVFIEENNGYVDISIEDTGIGISTEDQEFIFNRFTQVDGNGATKASSSGIGLTLVKHVVELHGGRISLVSELNKGSRFTISLPDIIDATEESNI